MKLKILFSALGIVIGISAANGQMFTPQKMKSPQISEQATVSKPDSNAQAPIQQNTPEASTAEDILKQVQTENINTPPVSMTPQQKAAVKKTLVEQIINDVDQATPKERQELINVMEQLQKAQIRRQNLNKPEAQQIKQEKPRVNVNSKEDVQKYLQDKLVAPIDRTMNIQ